MTEIRLELNIKKKRPLCYASSGGGGHISAMEGILEHLKTQLNYDLPSYTPQLPENRWFSFVSILIRIGIWAMSWSPIRQLVSLLGFTKLPEQEAFWHEMNELRAKQVKITQNQPPTRAYCDLLLDVYPSGYEFAAIFNAMQANDNHQDIKKAIASQWIVDMLNYRVVYNATLKKLRDAAQSDTPYTEIISTQPQAMGALCDAVLAYNKEYGRQPTIQENLNALQQQHEKLTAEKKNTTSKLYCRYLSWRLERITQQHQSLRDAYEKTKHLDKIVIKQYMTDLPSKGAIHFSGPLNALTFTQRQQIQLYAVIKNECTLRIESIEKFIRHTPETQQTYSDSYIYDPINKQCYYIGYDLKAELNLRLTHPQRLNLFYNEHSQQHSSISLNNAQIKHLFEGHERNRRGEFDAAKFSISESYQQLHLLDPTENPMVRAGFRQQYQENTIYFNENDPKLKEEHASVDSVLHPLLANTTTYRDLLDHSEEPLVLNNQSKVLSIMLGAVGGNALQTYLTEILNTRPDYDHVFVFRSGNTDIDQKIKLMLQSAYPDWVEKVHVLPHQSAQAIASIMTRSDTVITRSGGLSVMEHLALNVRPGKLFLIHHPGEKDDGTLTSGIDWEDDNANIIEKHMQENGGYVRKTRPDKIADHLTELNQEKDAPQASHSPSRMLRVLSKPRVSASPDSHINHELVDEEESKEDDAYARTRALDLLERQLLLREQQVLLREQHVSQREQALLTQHDTGVMAHQESLTQQRSMN